MKKRCYAVLLFIAFGCSNQKDIEPVYEVPDEFQYIVETFIEQAALRGKNFQISNLIIRYDDELESNVCGRCNAVSSLDTDIQKIILINTDKCWLNNSQKEALIFHELGHCFLGRSHDETLLPNGDPKSMMVPDDISIYSGCIYALGGDNSCDKTYRRGYYLDELFNADTPIPDWAN